MLFPIFNFKINETGLRPPCFPVQAPVLYGFRQMACLDIRRGFQVGDRTGDFQDAVEARAERLRRCMATFSKDRPAASGTAYS